MDETADVHSDVGAVEAPDEPLGSSMSDSTYDIISQSSFHTSDSESETLDYAEDEDVKSSVPAGLSRIDQSVQDDADSDSLASDDDYDEDDNGIPLQSTLVPDTLCSTKSDFSLQIPSPSMSSMSRAEITPAVTPSSHFERRTDDVQDKILRNSDSFDTEHTVSYTIAESKGDGASVVIRLSLASHYLHIKRPFRILFHGRPNLREHIIEKIAKALAVPNKKPKKDNTNRFNVIQASKRNDREVESEVTLIPSDGLEIIVQDCTACRCATVHVASDHVSGNQYYSASILSLQGMALDCNEGAVLTNVAGSVPKDWIQESNVNNFEHYAWPDVAIVTHPNPNSPHLPQSQIWSHEHADQFKRLGIPTLEILEEPITITSVVEGLAFEPWKGEALHMYVNIDETPQLGAAISRCIPFDITSFMHINANQLNRHLARLEQISSDDSVARARKFLYRFRAAGRFALHYVEEKMAHVQQISKTTLLVLSERLRAMSSAQIAVACAVVFLMLSNIFLLSYLSYFRYPTPQIAVPAAPPSCNHYNSAWMNCPHLGKQNIIGGLPAEITKTGTTELGQQASSVVTSLSPLLNSCSTCKSSIRRCNMPPHSMPSSRLPPSGLPHIRMVVDQKSRKEVSWENSNFMFEHRSDGHMIMSVNSEKDQWDPKFCSIELSRSFEDGSPQKLALHEVDANRFEIVLSKSQPSPQQRQIIFKPDVRQGNAIMFPLPQQAFWNHVTSPIRRIAFDSLQYFKMAQTSATLRLADVATSFHNRLVTLRDVTSLKLEEVENNMDRKIESYLASTLHRVNRSFQSLNSRAYQLSGTIKWINSLLQNFHINSGASEQNRQNDTRLQRVLKIWNSSYQKFIGTRKAVSHGPFSSLQLWKSLQYQIRQSCDKVYRMLVKKASKRAEELNIITQIAANSMKSTAHLARQRLLSLKSKVRPLSNLNQPKNSKFFNWPAKKRDTQKSPDKSQAAEIGLCKDKKRKCKSRNSVHNKWKGSARERS